MPSFWYHFRNMPPFVNNSNLFTAEPLDYPENSWNWNALIECKFCSRWTNGTDVDEEFVKCFTRARFLNDLISPKKNVYIAAFLTKNRKWRIFSHLFWTNCQFLHTNHSNNIFCEKKLQQTLARVRRIKQKGYFLRQFLKIFPSPFFYMSLSPDSRDTFHVWTDADRSITH